MSEPTDFGGYDPMSFAGIDRSVAPEGLQWSAPTRSISVEELLAIADEERRKSSCLCPRCGAIAVARERLAGDSVRAFDVACYLCDWRETVLR